MMTAPRPGVTSYTTPSDREVAVIRVLDAPRTLAFDAWTNPRHVPHWLTGPDGWTMPICEMDQRPGGKWRYVYRKDDGSEMTLQGVYREFTPPERIVSTETWGPNWPETVNTVTFVEANGQTTVTVTILFVSREARDAALQSGMKVGMDAGFARLEQLLDSLS